MIKRIVCASILLVVLASFLFGCSQQQKKNEAVGATDITTLKGAPHSYIKDANELVFNEKSNDGYALEAVRFVSNNTMLVVKSNKVDYKFYLCDLNSGTVRALPDVLKNADIYSYDQALKNGDMFFKTTPVNGNSGVENDYVIIDGSSLAVKKKIDAPDGVDAFISISPDEKNLVYQKNSNLYISDLDFKNEIMLLKGVINPNDETLNEVPKYGVFYNGNGILYRWLGYEWTEYCGTIDKDAKNNRKLPNSQGLTLFVTNKLDKYIYNDLNSFEYGMYDAQSGNKTKIFADKTGQIVAYAFNRDLNYFVACYAQDTMKYTGSKMEIYGIDGKKKAEFIKKDADMYPISLTVSPDGKQMAFLDGTATGDWKIYIMDMNKYM